MNITHKHIGAKQSSFCFLSLSPEFRRQRRFGGNSSPAAGSFPEVALSTVWEVQDLREFLRQKNNVL